MRGMHSIRVLILIGGALFAANSFAAKAPQSCTLVSGTLVQLPQKQVFKFNKARSYNNTGYPMTHTQFYIKDAQGEIYKVVMDNLFYTNLTVAQSSMNSDAGIIDDFTRRYAVGSSVEACGKIYHRGADTGIHFVHPSGCEKTKFNGFLHINGLDVSSNSRYCNACSCQVSYN